MANQARCDDRSSHHMHVRLRTVLACSVICLTSCGVPPPRTVPVGGRVSFVDGSPVGNAGIELAIEVQGRRFNARGFADPDGRFILGTFRAADGALPGEHAAIVVGPPTYTDGDVMKTSVSERVPERYNAYATSGLTVVVPESGGEIAIRVERK